MFRTLVILGLALGFAPAVQAQQSPSQAACATGDGEACFYTGAEYAQGQGVPENKQRAVDFFLRACNLGVPDGCNTAGYLMSVGEGNLERNVELGVEYMAQACTMGHEDGCSRSLGHFISASSPARNYGRAVATARAGCEAGVRNPCLWGLDWSWDGNSGDHPDMINLENAAWFAERACDRYRDIKGCDVAARVYANPEASTFDAEKGLRYSIIRCDEQQSGGDCRNVAAVYISIEEHRLGASYYERACSFGHAESCGRAREWQTYFRDMAAYEANRSARMVSIDQPLAQGRYAEAVSTAINTARSRELAERAILATRQAGRMGDIATNDLYAAALWFSSGPVRQAADAELAARGTGLEGRFGTGTNSPGAADARWRELYGSSAPTYTSSSSGSSSAPPPMPSATDIAAATRDRYRYAHCTMSGSNTSAQVCQ